MSSAASTPSREPEYAWELATLYPAQGAWSEKEYLHLTDDTNRRIEFTDGRLEFLPMPTEVHQILAAFFYHALYQFVHQRALGVVHYSGIRVRIRPAKVREPDVVFLHKDHYHLRHNRIWGGADLVMEVVSEDSKDRARDYETKLADYAEAGIAEYWIIDPEQKCVSVHRLNGAEYTLHGRFKMGELANSLLLPGLEIDVTALFDSVKDIPE